MLINFKKILKGLNLLIPFFYITLGCILLTNLFAHIDRGKRIIFGVIIIMYGFFRIYRVYAKTRDMT
jgi:hypothetical protein